MTLDELKYAIEEGHKASTVLEDVLRELDEYFCQKSYGFGGPDTFSPCETCIVCLAKLYIMGVK